MCQVLVPRGRLPARLRAAADRVAARALELRRHPPHLRPRGHALPVPGLPPRRPSDGDPARRGRRDVDVLPGRQGDRQPRGALHGGDPADREDADAGRLLVPPQPRAAVRLSRQRPLLHRQLPGHDAEDDRDQVRARPAAREGPRRPLHPPCRSRAELLDGGRACRGLLPGRSVLGGRGRRRRPLRAAARRRQRGGAEDAAPDREGREHPRLPRRASRTARRS